MTRWMRSVAALARWRRTRRTAPKIRRGDVHGRPTASCTRARRPAPPSSASRYVARSATSTSSARAYMAKGMLKLARPNPADRAQPVPRRSRAAFGRSSSGTRTAAARARTTFTSCSIGTGASRSSAARARGARWHCRTRALDRGSLQVALMRDLAATGAPRDYRLADEDSVAELRVHRQRRRRRCKRARHRRDAHLHAAARRLLARTWLWVAPELGSCRCGSSSAATARCRPRSSSKRQPASNRGSMRRALADLRFAAA